VHNISDNVTREWVVVGDVRSGDAGAVSPGNADLVGLAAVVVGAVLTVGLGALPTHWAGVVRRVEPANHEVADLVGGDRGTDGFDHPAELVTDRRGFGTGEIPPYRHRSEPHTQAATVRTTASVGFRTTGSGRSS
jgi:hypothetical protein